MDVTSEQIVRRPKETTNVDEKIGKMDELNVRERREDLQERRIPAEEDPKINVIRDHTRGIRLDFSTRRSNPKPQQYHRRRHHHHRSSPHHKKHDEEGLSSLRPSREISIPTPSIELCFCMSLRGRSFG
ncbi:hypothetical protein A7U60_g8510 [Sanghuangporus baumii]|uniref:Uncharacterized protein n=1 Tax=Sanghuangporus baumii TaxID=108892 RepID=A0A9Q5HRG9_SANBA|nr:hypothetical protein A7U60_g8510 [Sanghuangporus baumii]